MPIKWAALTHEVQQVQHVPPQLALRALICPSWGRRRPWTGGPLGSQSQNRWLWPGAGSRRRWHRPGCSGGPAPAGAQHPINFHQHPEDFAAVGLLKGARHSRGISCTAEGPCCMECSPQTGKATTITSPSADVPADEPAGGTALLGSPWCVKLADLRGLRQGAQPRLAEQHLRYLPSQPCRSRLKNMPVWLLHFRPPWQCHPFQDVMRTPLCMHAFRRCTAAQTLTLHPSASPPPSHSLVRQPTFWTSLGCGPLAKAKGDPDPPSSEHSSP